LRKVLHPPTAFHGVARLGLERLESSVKYSAHVRLSAEDVVADGLDKQQQQQWDEHCWQAVRANGVVVPVPMVQMMYSY